MEDKSTFESFDQLSLDAQGKSFLQETAKWANILSIIGYISVALMGLAAVFMLTQGNTGSSLTQTPFGSSFGSSLAAVYLVLAVIYIFPIYYLGKFASNMKNALKSNDKHQLNEAFGFLKSHYKFIGIFTLVIIIIYFLIFIGAIIYGANLI